MADFKKYDPNQIVITWKGILITGFAPGTFVNIARDNDGFSKSVGAGGDVTRVRNRDRSGKVTVTLQAESSTNDFLSAQAVEDELFGTGVGPVLVKNLNGTTLCQAENAWIMKVPDTEYGDDGSSREWVLDCAELLMFIGGAVS